MPSNPKKSSTPFSIKRRDKKFLGSMDLPDWFAPSSAEYLKITRRFLCNQEDQQLRSAVFNSGKLSIGFTENPKGLSFSCEKYSGLSYSHILLDECLNVQELYVDVFLYLPGTTIIPFFCGDIEIVQERKEIKFFFQYKENRKVDPREFSRPFRMIENGDYYFKFVCRGENFDASKFLASARLFCRSWTYLDYRKKSVNEFTAYLGDAFAFNHLQQLEVAYLFLESYKEDLVRLRDEYKVESSEIFFLHWEGEDCPGSPRRLKYTNKQLVSVPEALLKLSTDLRIELITAQIEEWN